MADWKLPVSCNYNPSYHAYAYGLMYPQGPEQNHQNLGWAEAYNHQGVSGGYYSAPQQQQPQQQQQQHQSPHRNLENGHATSAHFPGSVLYFADSHTQTGRLFLSDNRTQCSQRPTEIERASSDTPSDSEAHTPDSWSSGSSREVAPQAPTSWREGEEEDVESGSPDSTGHVSSTLTIKEEEPFPVGVEREEQTPLPVTTPQSVPAPPRKAKARTAFSEDQMTALTHRFSVQRYLTPVEMKTLAGMTGLTYKQVKTWFQNRRMKLKRHQKDTSWVSERCSDPTYRNIAAPHSQFQMDTSGLAQEHYSNPQFREAIFKKSPPQTPTYYQNYPRPQSPRQPPTRAHGSWNLPPANHFEFNANNYHNNANSSINSDDGTPVDAIQSPTRMVMVQSAAQWST